MSGFHATDEEKTGYFARETRNMEGGIQNMWKILYVNYPTSCKTKKEKWNWEKVWNTLEDKRKKIFGWKWKDDFYLQISKPTVEQFCFCYIHAHAT